MMEGRWTFGLNVIPWQIPPAQGPMRYSILSHASLHAGKRSITYRLDDTMRSNRMSVDSRFDRASIYMLNCSSF
jgi:hypothetical protein